MNSLKRKSRETTKPSTISDFVSDDLDIRATFNNSKCED